AKIDASAPAA
ncbi:hypothetical protein MKD33_19310, partial [Chromobacterium piscinae]